MNQDEIRKAYQKLKEQASGLNTKGFYYMPLFKFLDEMSENELEVLSEYVLKSSGFKDLYNQ